MTIIMRSGDKRRNIAYSSMPNFNGAMRNRRVVFTGD
jgi:hypothetical protein